MVSCPKAPLCARSVDMSAALRETQQTTAACPRSVVTEHHASGGENGLLIISFLTKSCGTNPDSMENVGSFSACGECVELAAPYRDSYRV